MQEQYNGIAKILSFTPPSLMTELRNLEMMVEHKTRRGEFHKDPNWQGLCDINNLEKKNQQGYMRGDFLPTLNFPSNSIKGKIIDLGKGRKILLDKRLGHTPVKIYVDFGFGGDKLEVRYIGKMDAISTGDKKINRVVNRQQNPKRSTKGDLSAKEAKAYRKQWHGDAVIYYLWAIVDGVKYGYVGCTKIRDNEADEDVAILRRAHDHVVSGSAIGELLEQASEGNFGHLSIKPLYSVDSEYAYNLEGRYIDLLHERALASGGDLVRVNIHNNGDSDYIDAVRRTSENENQYKHYSAGKNKNPYTVSDKRQGEEYAKRVKRSRDIVKTIDYAYKVNIIKMLINKGMSLSGQGTMNWLVNNKYLPLGIGRTVIYRWHKEVVKNGDL